MFKRKLAKVIVSLLRRIANVSRAGAKRLMRAMLRSLMAMGRRAKLPVAGFVLPTVTMVMLVVVLLTLAITLRSFDRSQNARNVRVNQQVLAAATPALERAKAKIEYLLNEDPTRPTGTPSDISIKRALSKPSTGADTYTFNDEIRLRVGYKLERSSLQDWDSTNEELVENKEVINTAWRFPVDTDNNGKFDSYTIYGVYFRSPPRSNATGATSGQFLAERKPLETRTPPMPGTLGNQQCAAALGTSASLVGDSGWYQSDGKLKKSFYVYTVTVPITDSSPAAHNASIDATQLEQYKGTKGFSALEYQEDRVRVPLLNNAVVYEDDLEISPGPAFRINGGMLTNSNLLVTSTNSQTVDIFLISGENSCYYKQENSKIFVGGNVVNGWAGGAPTGTSTIHLFQPAGSTPLPETDTITTTNQSVNEAATAVLYNGNAYARRIAALVNAQIAAFPDPVVTPVPPNANDPTSVQKAVSGDKDRDKALQTYFETLTRKVPFAEVGVGVLEDTTGTVIEAGSSGDTLRPIQAWALPTNVNADASIAQSDGPTTLNIRVDQLAAQNPNPNGGTKPSKEDFLGDRIIAGNNLPLKWWNGTKFVGGTTAQEVDGGTWSDGSQRTRTSQKQVLAAVGISDRGDYWEKAAAQKPENPLTSIGGLRVITGAGVYERTNSFLPPPSWLDQTTNTMKTAPTDGYDDPATTTVTEAYPVVWPDSMPMSPVLESQRVYNNGTTDTVTTANSWATTPLPATSAALPPATTPTIDPNTLKYAKGDLRMRATAVYHYAQDYYDQPDFDSEVYLKKSQAPIACISSYYDPSTASTARNLSTLADDVSGEITSGTRDANIGSNNGIVYGPPTYTIPTAAAIPANGILTGTPQELYDQANMVFPDGRFVNEQLRTALMKPETGRNLAEQAAIDSTACAFGILNTSADFTLGTPATIPAGAIKEVALLNSREVKAVDADDPATTTVDETFTLNPPGTTSANSGNYNLALEERMPLEIRVTQIDLNLLRNTTIPLASGIKGPSPEYLLPNSGIIYASRDDAAPDRSDRAADATNTAVIPYGIDAVQSGIVSRTDSILDPTRRPHGIMLINGRFLARNDADNDGQNDTAPTNISDVVKEKGLTLVSNLPVYVQDNFNVHSQEEFGPVGNLNQPSWGNFYSRALPLNPNFACRPGDPRLPNCTDGDTWRAATVLADAVTVLSRNFRPGFRNEGDFDLRNNAGAAAVTGGYDLDGDGTIAGAETTPITAKAARLLNGFYNNNFVTNGLSSGATFNINGTDVSPTDSVTPDPNYSATGGTAPNSSYFNNFVTPVQRRGAFPEYVMEMCLKLPVSACGPGDWQVNATGTPVKASDVIGQARGVVDSGSGTTAIPAGTTTPADVPLQQRLQHYPRRVAFRRNPANNQLLFDGSTPPLPIPIGILGGNIQEFGVTLNANATQTGIPDLAANNNGLRFKTTTSTTLPSTTATYTATATDRLFYQNAPIGTVQPQLAPVLQIHVTQTGDPTGANTGRTDLNNTRWLSQAETTDFNLVVAASDIPSRPNGDSNGGMQNLTRFIENWNPTTLGTQDTRIQGSFIQLSRSAYSTAPYVAILNKTPTFSLFDYPSVYKIQNAGGTVPTFVAPNRQWGYDVGLLSQSPDLFTQLFTTPTTQTNSDKFFREVGRDDVWVKTLLCAKKDETPTENAVSDDQRPTQFCDDNAPTDWDKL
ncbi:hormogonium polysaccharide biosynthesis protein HpsA [Kamptonema sp. UHCC 0994]|uniref:hormogonium polysaccharide biosynthesis protein HpsA n=1 Tax=Kamptonema sp. UHCC 0994 TaxID=3031329 RepID=UPI0023B90463|nr:hormogonium polysaccharide biosynthesis protein HpsA [Kamptonema sp. UHCC 0994]MDF0555811.1 hormogonium polysaccharide biosynthesis protein HpsA [Kamptonema sp. UHCC 0994]